MNGETTAVMVVVQDGRVSEIRVEPLERLLPLLAALAIRNGQIRLDEEEDDADHRPHRGSDAA